MATIRSYIFIDQLQPKTHVLSGHLHPWRAATHQHGGSGHRGTAGPRHRAASPTWRSRTVDVQPGLLVVERQFGYLEFHSHSTAAVKAAGEAILDRPRSASEADAMKPEILASKIVQTGRQLSRLPDQPEQGGLDDPRPANPLFVLEMQPAAYSILAANEAEKSADVKLVDYRMMGATGRLYLSGPEADMQGRGPGRRRRPPGGEALSHGARRSPRDEIRRMVRESAARRRWPAAMEAARARGACPGTRGPPARWAACRNGYVRPSTVPRKRDRRFRSPATADLNAFAQSGGALRPGARPAGRHRLEPGALPAGGRSAGRSGFHKGRRRQSRRAAETRKQMARHLSIGRQGLLNETKITEIAKDPRPSLVLGRQGAA